MAVSLEEATAELNAVLSSPAFARSPRLTRLLTYLCTKYLAGEADQIKEYNIGVEVLERPSSFDPASDAGARVEVLRLRRRLQQYYETEGAARKFRIVVPTGRYIPLFVPNITEEETPSGITPSQAGGQQPYRLVTDILAEEPGPAARPKIPGAFLATAGLVLLTGTFLLVLPARKPALPATISGLAAAPLSASPRHSLPLAPPPASNSVRLSCGRSVSYTDRSGQSWAADEYFEGGTAFDSTRQFIARAEDPRLFQNGRSGDFKYRIPLPQGNYELRLGFVETSFGPGTSAGGGEYSRTFDVKANGRTLLDDFDIYSDANGSNIADTRVFKDIAPASDGFLHLEFHSRRGPALVNVIELSAAPPHRLNPIHIVAQENFVTLADGTVWSPDVYVNGGQLSNHLVSVTAGDPDIYARERFGHFDYAIPVDTGTYGVSLHFAEEYFGPTNPGGGGAGSRLFDVFCNGTFLLRNFDIFAEAGMNRGLVKTFHGLTPNAQGKLLLSFVPVRNYASLYAIEVTDESH